MGDEDTKYIKRQIKMALENCACLGRDAYGDYIERLATNLTKMIETEFKDKKNEGIK